MTENVETLNAVTLTMASGDMLNLLGNAVLFAPKNGSAPILEYVHLAPKFDTVRAYATDRYRVARVELPLIEVVGDLDGLQLLLHREHAMQFAKALKALKRDLATLSEVSDASLQVQKVAKLIAVIAEKHNGSRYVSAWKLEWHGGNAQVSTELEHMSDNGFPRLDPLIDPDLPSAEDATGLMVLSPALLADFLKVKNLMPGNKPSPIGIVGGRAKSKPVTIQYENWFTGVIQPASRTHAAVNYGSARDRDEAAKVATY